MTIQAQGTRAYAIFTKRIRIPLDVISAVKPLPTGDGAVVVTDRGCNVVIERYDGVVAAIWGDGSTAPERGTR